MGWRPSSSVVRRALTFSSQELLSQSLKNLVCSICRVRRQEIANFMTPIQKRGNFGVKSGNLMHLVENLLWGMVQTNLVCSNDDQERVYQNF